MTRNFSGASPAAAVAEPVRTRATLKVFRMRFAENAPLGGKRFLQEWRSSMSLFSKMIAAEFQVTSVRTNSGVTFSPGFSGVLETRVRFELVGTGTDFHREQRVGNWELEWDMRSSGEMQLQKWRTLDETRSRSLTPIFIDIASRAFGGEPSYVSQLVPGTDYWRTVLDGACGIDIYGHNGVSVADIDGDGLDDLYVCQPAGLPNRLYRNRGDGTFEDITEMSGLGILENSACALFVDVDNDGRQDAIIVRADGPLLFLNEGGGKFRRRPDAFRFANSPQGAFTGAAVADYDRGWLVGCLFLLVFVLPGHRPIPVSDALLRCGEWPAQFPDAQQSGWNVSRRHAGLWSG